MGKGVTKILSQTRGNTSKKGKRNVSLEKPLSRAKKEVAKQDKSYSLILNPKYILVSIRNTKYILFEFYLSIYSST